MYLLVPILCFMSLLSLSLSSYHDTISNSPVDYVNTLSGTKSQRDFSTGNTLPEVTAPWGFNGWTPETDQSNGGGWFFYSESRKFYGIRCTKQPSPWISDYGQFRVMAYFKNPEKNDASQFSAYDPNQSSFLPYYFNATLLSFGGRSGYITMEVTPTFHGAVIRIKYPKPTAGSLATDWDQTRRVMFMLDGGGRDLVVGTDPVTGRTTVTGASTQSSAHGISSIGGDRWKWSGHFFHATISGGGSGNDVVTPLGTSTTGTSGDGQPLRTFLSFDSGDEGTETLIIRVATSLISADQAKANYDGEVANFSFDEVRDASKAEWNDLFSRISVDEVGPGLEPQQERDYLTIFYSSLYRASKYPRKLYETDAAGKFIHWSPHTGNVTSGRLSSDQGFWDAYRTTYSLQTLLWPRRMCEIFDGWLSVYKESGWIVQWTSPGHRNSMTGTMSDVSVAEALAKLPHCGSTLAETLGYCVDAPSLYDASRKNAYVAPPQEGFGSKDGRDCLEHYINLGYLPYDLCGASVSTSLNYYHSDWALAQAAKLLGREDDAKDLLKRSEGWRNLLEPETAFFRPRDSSGNFYPKFDEFGWGNFYTEAGPWQYRLEVPFDPAGLKSELEKLGRDACEIVQEANLITGAAHPYGYGSEIHEMAEMQINCWGQFSLNNQPNWILQHMQAAFDGSVRGNCSSQAQYWLRKSNSLFRPGADMYAGDEDNGSFGAWFIFNALGFYPLSPASGNFTFGSPLFKKVTIQVDGAAHPLVISAVNQGPSNVYVKQVKLNGKVLIGTSISNSDLVGGGLLEFTMSSSSIHEKRPFKELGLVVLAIAGLILGSAFGFYARGFQSRQEEDKLLLKPPKSKRKEEGEQEESETLTKL